MEDRGVYSFLSGWLIGWLQPTAHVSDTTDFWTTVLLYIVDYSIGNMRPTVKEPWIFGSLVLLNECVQGTG